MSTPDKIWKDGSTKLNNDDVCEVNDKLQNMSTADKDNNDVSICANCGKEGSDNDMNTCNKCKMVKYCNAVCKKVHKKKHKKDCEEHVRLAAEHAAKLHDEELRIAAKLHDEKLFKQPPPLDDCPICFLLLPSLDPTRGGNIKHAAEKLYAVDVFMHLFMITKGIKLIIKSVLFVELRLLNQMKITLKGIRND